MFLPTITATPSAVAAAAPPPVAVPAAGAPPPVPVPAAAAAAHAVTKVRGILRSATSIICIATTCTSTPTAYASFDPGVSSTHFDTHRLDFLHQVGANCLDWHPHLRMQ